MGISADAPARNIILAAENTIAKEGAGWLDLGSAALGTEATPVANHVAAGHRPALRARQPCRKMANVWPPSRAIRDGLLRGICKAKGSLRSYLKEPSQPDDRRWKTGKKLQGFWLPALCAATHEASWLGDEWPGPAPVSLAGSRLLASITVSPSNHLWLSAWPSQKLNMEEVT